MKISVNQRISLNWNYMLAIAVPLLLLPLIFIQDDSIIEGTNRKSTKFKAAYVIILIAVYWMLEVLPLAVTSLLPAVFFPMLGVMGTSEVSRAYMKETNLMFVGGLMLALAIEYCNLHRRIALNVLLVIGSSPIRLMFGVMLVSMFLSMWMSNTSCCAMMVPIVMAVLEELTKTPEKLRKTSTGGSRKHPIVSFRKSSKPDGNINGSVDGITIDVNSPLYIFGNDEEERQRYKINTKKMLLFAVAYSCNIGGTGVITGTGSNLAFQGIIKGVDVGQNGKYTDISFATWIAFNIIPMLVNGLVSFIYLVWVYFGIPNWRDWPLVSLCAKKDSDSPAEKLESAKNEAAYKILQNEYQKLGKMSFHERGVAVLYTLVVVLWMTRDPKFITGWAETLPGYPIVEAGDSTAAMLVIFLMFLVPRDPSFIFGTPPPGAKNEALLDWPYIQRKMPWGMMLLLGGGFAMSDASGFSGLSQWIGEQLNNLKELPDEAILIIVMILSAIVTEVATNVACVNIILPILISMSRSLDIHPLYLTIAATVACSYAFMLPVATPPNAIAFAAGGGDLRVIDMVKTGAFLNVSCTVIFFLIHITWGNFIFDFKNYDWPNATSTFYS